MQCFIHTNKEAQATCKTCGKAMCIDCSSFAEHSGICPTCKKVDMDREVDQLRSKIKRKTAARRTRLAFSIIFFFLIIPLCLYPSYKRRINKEIGVLESKIAGIQKSLGFVNQALKRGSGSLEHSAADDEINDSSWQCPFCRTINNGSKTCKFCARKRP